MRFKIQNTFLLFVLLGTVSPCNTFKDEIAPDYNIENYLPFLVKKNGTWRIDNLTYPFFLTFQEEGAEREAITEITYPIVQGKRHITLTISPGCSSNSYVYSFEKIEE